MSDFAIAGAYVAILGVAGVLAFVVTLWLTNWRRIYSAIAASLVTVSAVWCVCVFPWSTPVAEVYVREPRETLTGESPWFSIEGTVSPPDATVRLLVQPSAADPDMMPSWWVQPPPRIVGGAWKAEICLGTAQRGADEYFQIVAVASPRPRLIDLLHHQRLDEGQRLNHIPALPRSEIVTIWRSR